MQAQAVPIPRHLITFPAHSHAVRSPCYCPVPIHPDNKSCHCTYSYRKLHVLIRYNQILLSGSSDNRSVSRHDFRHEPAGYLSSHHPPVSVHLKLPSALRHYNSRHNKVPHFFRKPNNIDHGSCVFMLYSIYCRACRNRIPILAAAGHINI